MYAAGTYTTDQLYEKRVFKHEKIMSHTIIGLCTLELYLPGVASLKEKRSIIKSITHKSRQQFNVAVAEVDHHDVWQSALLAMTTVGNSTQHVNSVLSKLTTWFEIQFPDVVLVHETIEII